MTTPPTAPRATPAAWGAWVLLAIFLAIAALICATLYYVYPQSNHWYALLAIGIVGLFFSLGSYLAEAASREPTIQRSLAWGFFGFGFAVLLITIGVGPMYNVLSTVWMLIGLTVTLAALFISVGLIMWRVRAVARTAGREAPREAWRQEPTPSAFSYAAANSPSVPAVTPPPPSAPSSPPRNP